ncbi:protein-disulfide isomerase [Rhizobium sp. Leaf306]|uniref:DsbA family protein n=1 Tax=Rhizobium sp. Leaf306 TaxID=1736330 RepID=UPI000712881F|nr:DsbA family protein [Rhizobium sp. Leaf306]KQQ34834.1 protein-disulfide isomerase [Rhizobium sp. Leaf306]
MSDKVHITYLFDPLCGWCYGASGIKRELSSRPEIAVEMTPTGLFSGRGARQLDAQFAAFAWSNDLRIAALTGRTFTEEYREQVLCKHGGMLDSVPATLALTAVSLTAPETELDALRLIQEARYIRGLDVTENLVLIDTLKNAGFGAAAALLRASDEGLLEANHRRLVSARALKDQFRVDGVPALIVDDGEIRRPLGASGLFGDPDLLSTLLRPRVSAVAATRSHPNP